MAGTIPVPVGREGFTDVGQQGQTIVREPFASPDDDLARAPMNVVEL
jgi:hypothetical protein